MADLEHDCPNCDHEKVDNSKWNLVTSWNERLAATHDIFKKRKRFTVCHCADGDGQVAVKLATVGEQGEEIWVSPHTAILMAEKLLMVAGESMGGKRGPAW